ncbi:MAG: hypothetical protein SCH98_12650 [Deferrisomatales bacterium]|nr:hypothetical protein [Deferrisomatales bacterium]
MHLTLVVFGLATLALAMWSWNEDADNGKVEKVPSPTNEPDKTAH